MKTLNIHWFKTYPRLTRTRAPARFCWHRCQNTFSDYLGQFKTIWDYLGLSVTISNYLRLYRTIWDYMGLSVTICDYHGLSGTIWDYLGWSWTILDNLRLSQNMVQVEAGENKLMLFETFSGFFFSSLERFLKELRLLKISIYNGMLFILKKKFQVAL